MGGFEVLFDFLKGMGEDSRGKSETDAGMAEVGQGEGGEELEQGSVEELGVSVSETVFGKEIGTEQDEGSSTGVEDAHAWFHTKLLMKQHMDCFFFFIDVIWCCEQF